MIDHDGRGSTELLAMKGCVRSGNACYQGQQ